MSSIRVLSSERLNKLFRTLEKVSRSRKKGVGRDKKRPPLKEENYNFQRPGRSCTTSTCRRVEEAKIRKRKIFQNRIKLAKIINFPALSIGNISRMQV